VVIGGGGQYYLRNIKIENENLVLGFDAPQGQMQPEALDGRILLWITPRDKLQFHTEDFPYRLCVPEEDLGRFEAVSSILLELDLKTFIGRSADPGCMEALLSQGTNIMGEHLACAKMWGPELVSLDQCR
jgi:hypothetical protein